MIEGTDSKIRKRQPQPELPGDRWVLTQPIR